MANPLSCDRCHLPLEPGRGDFHVVHIEAFADPSGPIISAEELTGDIRGRIEALIAKMRDVPEQELLDGVYRRMTIYLCGRCFRRWIENPVG